MTTKILIGGGELAKLLTAHPEIEIELTKQAAMQVVETFKRKVNTTSIVDGMIQRINGELAQKYHIPQEIKDSISKIAKEAVDRALNDEAKSYVYRQLDQAIKNYMPTLEARVTEKLNDMIMKGVGQAIKAAAKLGV